jgi:hypothetical protein
MHKHGAGLGSPGVFFIQTEEGVAVLKVSTTFVGELYAQYLLRNACTILSTELKLPLDVPDARVLVRNGGGSTSEGKNTAHMSEDYTHIQDGLLRLQPLRNYMTYKDNNLIHRLCGASYMMIMDYVNGRSYQARFTAMQAAQQWTKIPDRILQCYGATVFLDLLINNWDRIPMHKAGFWRNEGNHSNVMFQYRRSQQEEGGEGGEDSSSIKLRRHDSKTGDTHGDSIVLIDQCVTAQHNPTLKQAYLGKLTALMQNATQERAQYDDESTRAEMKSTCFSSVRDFLKSGFEGFDIGLAGELQVLVGFTNVATRLLQQDTLERLVKQTDEKLIKQMHVRADASLHSESEKAVLKEVRECSSFVSEVVAAIRKGLE